MPFTPVPDKNAGDPFLEVMWDTYIRDNENFIAAALAAYVLAYNEFTAPVTVTATTEATANAIATATAVTLASGDIIWVEFFIPRIGTNSDLHLWLYDGAASIGRLALQGNGYPNSLSGRVRLVCPTNVAAGAHTFSIRGQRNQANLVVTAGPGGAGQEPPGFIRISKALA